MSLNIQVADKDTCKVTTDTRLMTAPELHLCDSKDRALSQIISEPPRPQEGIFFHLFVFFLRGEVIKFI